MASAKLAARLLVSSNVALRSAAMRRITTSGALQAGAHGGADVDGVAPQVPTGIQYAEEAKQLGHSRHKQDFKDYKCSEYLHFNQLSYYDVEVCKHRTETDGGR